MFIQILFTRIFAIHLGLQEREQLVRILHRPVKARGAEELRDLLLVHRAAAGAVKRKTNARSGDVPPVG